MGQPRIKGSATLTGRALLLSVACALAVVGPVRAQSGSFSDANDAGLAETDNRPASNRSLFVGTLVALIAQGLGHGVGTALSKGVGGSITRWFENKPKAADPIARSREGLPASQVAKGNVPQSIQGPSPQVAKGQAPHAGIAYEIHAIDQRGASKVVDATTHVFRTGDRFRIYYRPSLPGRIRVTNIDPAGGTNLVDRIEVAAGQLVNLGPYEFVGSKGRETVRLSLEPCDSAVLMAATRAIVKQPGSQSAQGAGNLRIRACDRQVAGKEVAPVTRAIRKTSTEGSTVYALDRLSAQELSSGDFNARAVDIALWHR